MAAVKASAVLCILLMALLLAPSCGKDVCYEWPSNTYKMLLLCSNKKCNRNCIDEGATSGKCGLFIVRSFCFCTKECD
ncbi:hypothetical protein ACP70R_018603 [Stipagrostis hirtigluma subsp. patula]